MRPNSKDRGPVNSSKDRPRQLRDVFLSHGWILEADFPHTPRMQHCDAQVRAAAPARALRPIFVITSSVTEPEQEPNARHPPPPSYSSPYHSPYCTLASPAPPPPDCCSCSDVQGTFRRRRRARRGRGAGSTRRGALRGRPRRVAAARRVVPHADRPGARLRPRR